MKITITILSIIFIAFIALQLMSFKSTSQTEMYSYEVLRTVGSIEIRKYHKALFIKTNLKPNKYEKVSSIGFRTLAGYIFGDNSSNQKIAMTSPVVMDMTESKSMYFMIPHKYERKDLPSPNNDDIEFIEKSAHVVAAVSFSGWANEEKIQSYISKLKIQLKENSIAHTNKFQFLGYNPPYEIINRRNEVIVELQ